MTRQASRRALPVVAGLAFIAVCYLPGYLMSLFAPDAMVWPPSASSGFEYGDVVLLLPGMILFAVLAPLAHYRRRDAFAVLLFPIFLHWIFTVGERVAQLSLMWTAPVPADIVDRPVASAPN